MSLTPAGSNHLKGVETPNLLRLLFLLMLAVSYFMVVCTFLLSVVVVLTFDSKAVPGQAAKFTLYIALCGVNWWLTCAYSS
mmetsp:Transcript_58169/g.96065  ORF Transcript_58169/g.96065 Transcript_58169/m.96065 type:complete len:81 (+) Transcript_58169:25-267(+)